MKKILTSLLILMMVFVSCSPDAGPTGELRVTVSDGMGERGISPIPMTPAYYAVRIEKGDEYYEKRLETEAGQAVWTVAAGEWTVLVKAFNANDDYIGSGISTVAVKGGETARCRVRITELAGNGTLSVEVDGSASASHTVKIYTASVTEGSIGETLMSTDALSGSGNSWSLTKPLEPGFYIVKVEDGNGSVVASDTVRIVSGKTTRFLLHISNEGRIEVSIVNSIVPTPAIDLRAENMIVSGQPYTVRAVTSGIDNPFYFWSVNGEVVPGANSDTFTATAPEALGNYTVTCTVGSGSTVWSESITMGITDKIFSGTWWGDSPNRDFHMRLEFRNGKLLMDKYDDGRALQDYETEYTLSKISSNDYRLDFMLYGRMWHFIIPGGNMEGTLELYTSPEDRYPWDIVFKPLTEEPVWTESFVEYNRSSHRRYITNPVYGTYETEGRGSSSSHTLENGICTVCGYDENTPLYGICSDPTLVHDHMNQIYVTRYWPGNLTLQDGTVINDTDHFYYRKWFGGLDAGYVLYIPHTITDFYEANNGVNSSDPVEALRWYVNQVLGIEWHESIWWEGSANDKFFNALFENEAKLKDLDPSLVTDKVTSRTTVSTDASLVPEDLENWAWGELYTVNDLQLEDGTPITDESRAYISYSEDGSPKLYLPVSVSEEYDRGDGMNGWGGNYFWWYLRTYYPDEMMHEDEPVGWKLVLTKVLSEFRTPSASDVTDDWKYGDNGF